MRPDTLEIVARENDRCGESPLWDASTGTLYWTDIEGALFRGLHLADGRIHILQTGLSVAGIALHRTGDLIIGGASGLYHWRGADDYTLLVSECDGETLAINDLIADETGRVYVATAYFDAGGEMTKYARLYRVDSDGSCRTVDEGIELGNGMGFSGDGRTFYLTDSTARRIYAYDRDPATGNLKNRRTLVQISNEEGLPDGLTVDAEDHLWSAQWYGAQIVRYAPDGAVVERVPLPVLQVSSVGFGGPDLTDLYITSAADSWRSRFAPPGYDFDAPNMGGELYRLRLQIQGRPEHRATL